MNRLFGAMPTDAATLYRGSVMHARLKPVGHRFVYRVLNLLIDLDRLEEAGLVERKPDPSDRRAWRLELTGKASSSLSTIDRKSVV